jgi:RNA polymerase sigma factor (TIGR02999 family)
MDALSGTGRTPAATPSVGAQYAPAEGVASPSVTELLAELAHGDSGAANALFTLLYDELRKIARRQLRSEPTGHTLSATALVHEAYLQLVDQTRAQWLNRAQFLAVAARAMRRILVDHARRVGAGKRGGGWQRLELGDGQLATAPRAEMLVALDEALNELSELNPRLTRVVECRFFGGMSEEETALALSVTDRTVRRDWVKAKGWLRGELGSMLES